MKYYAKLNSKIGHGGEFFQTIFGRKIKLITFCQWVRYSVPIQADRLPWKTTIKKPIQT